jgi:hypothetical protein
VCSLYGKQTVITPKVKVMKVCYGLGRFGIRRCCDGITEGFGIHDGDVVTPLGIKGRLYGAARKSSY